MEVLPKCFAYLHLGIHEFDVLLNQGELSEHTFHGFILENSAAYDPSVYIYQELALRDALITLGEAYLPKTEELLAILSTDYFSDLN